MFFSVRPPKAIKRESRRKADDQGEEYFHLGWPMFNTSISRLSALAHFGFNETSALTDNRPERR
jgi:hypothetical protein